LLFVDNTYYENALEIPLCDSASSVVTHRLYLRIALHTSHMGVCIYYMPFADREIPDPGGKIPKNRPESIFQVRPSH